jgi:uncharacterized protein YndB with AHSA1/START domain
MYANVTKVDAGHEIRYERRLNHPVEKVWEALTDPERLPAWLGRAEQLELSVGGAYEIHWENSDAVMDGTITELDPPRLLETDSSSHGRLRWELAPQPGGCELSLTVTMDAPDFLTKALAGWHLHIDVLESFLASGNRIDWEHDDWMSDWERLHERYVELYGAETGATG